MDFEADSGVSWQMTFSRNGAAALTGTESTNPYLDVTSGNTASVIGRLQSGDVKITLTAYDEFGASDSAEFTVTTVNAHGITGNNTITPDMNSITAVELTSTLRSRIADSYGVSESDVHSLYLESGVTIDSAARTLTQEDKDLLSKHSARMLYALPKMTVNQSGIYVWGISLKKYAAVGANIQEVFNIVSDYRGFKQNGEYVDFDEDSDYVLNPEDQYFITAALMQASQTYWGYIVIPADGTSELPVTVIEPLSYLSPDVMQNIADAISIDVGELKLLTAESLSDPQETTKAMRDEAAKDHYELAYKMDTVTVSEDGYYVFAVNLPDEFLSKDINSFRFYAFDRSIFSESSFMSSILELLNGVGTLADFNLDTPAKKILVVGLFQAGQPVCLYIARLILWLFGVPGCNFASMAGAGILSLGTAGVFIFMSHRKLRRKSS